MRNLNRVLSTRKKQFCWKI